MPWKKGESGNPHGRPPVENSLSDLLRKKLEDIDPEQECSNKDIIADALVSLAKQGNLAAIERVYDRVDGKPKQSMEVSGNIEFPRVVGFFPDDYSTTEDPDTNQE